MIWAQLFQRWQAALPWEWIQPSCCWLCGEPAAGKAPLTASTGVNWACAVHVLDSRERAAACGTCDRPLRAGLGDGSRCRSCLLSDRLDPRRKKNHALPPRLLSLGPYSWPALHPWILAFKHGKRVDLAHPLGALLAARVLGRWGGPGRLLCPGILVPVPLHPARRAERGYDQALELAIVLGRHLGWPVESRLVRVRSTAPQGSWRAPSRGRNVGQAFRDLGQEPAQGEGARIYLVDDVTTSGETLRSCAAALPAFSVRGALVLAQARVAVGPVP